MTDDRDATLQALFANAEEDLAGDTFTAEVMAKTRKMRNGAVAGWIGIALVLVLCAGLLAAPLQDAIHLLMQALTTPLIDLNGHGLGQILSPVNNATILLALGLIGLRLVYRKIFS